MNTRITSTGSTLSLYGVKPASLKEQPTLCHHILDQKQSVDRYEAPKKQMPG